MLQLYLNYLLHQLKLLSVLDEDYRFRRSLESGLRGSTRLPSFKIDVLRAYREIKQLYPAIRLLDGNSTLRDLAALVSRTGRHRSREVIERMIQDRSQALPRLP